MNVIMYSKLYIFKQQNQVTLGGPLVHYENNV